MKGRWEIKKLGDVCEVTAGQSPEGKHYNDAGEGLPFYQGKKDFGEKFIQAPRVWTREITKEALEGDILMSVRAPVGPINFSDTRICIGRGLASIRPLKGVDREFLFYALLLMRKEISGTEGAVFASINKSQIEGLRLPIPSLPEQRRIVAILDEAFAGLEAMRANAEKNLQNARELFRTSFEWLTREHNDKCKMVAVAELAANHKNSVRTGPFGSQLLHSEFVDEGIAVLGIDNVVANEFRWGKRRCITSEKYEALKRYQVFPGDVLITIMGTCGRCAIVPDNIQLAVNTKHLCCITLDQKKCMPEYLHAYFLYHPTSQSFLQSRAKGSIMDGLNMGIIKELPVVLPSLGDQRRLTDTLADLRRATTRLQEIYEQKLGALDELKQVILQKAFSGELISSESIAA